MKLNPPTVEDAPLPQKPRPPSKGRQLNNWLMAYRDYTNDNEAPEVYHLWCGLAAISAVSGRKVKITFQYFEVLTNMFLLIVGPSRKTRKTTAIKMARNMVRKVDGVHLLANVATPEAIIKALSKLPDTTNQAGTAVSYELGTMMGRDASQRAMIDFLTDMYDGNPEYEKETITRGTNLIENPWLSIIAATTPVWLGQNLDPSAIEGGFLARCLCIFADRRKLSNPLPEIDPEKESLKRVLISDLYHISTLEGEFKLDPEARAAYIKWYMDPSRFPSITDPRVDGYYNQKHIHLLKVAMLLSLSENDSLVITLRDLEAAMNMLASVEPGMHKTFASLGKNLFQGDTERIALQIAEAGSSGVEFKVLLRLNYHAMTKDRLDEALSTLVAMGRIKQTGVTFFLKSIE